MLRRLPLIIICVAVIAVPIVFWTGTFHDTEVKFFLFATLVMLLMVAATARKLFGRHDGDETAGGRVFHVAMGALLLYGTLSVLSVTWADYPLAAVLRSAEVVLYVAWTAMVAVVVRDRRDLSRLITVMLIGGIATAAAAYVLPHLFEVSAGQGTEQYRLPTGNPNWLAALMLVPMLLAAEGLLRLLFMRIPDGEGQGVPATWAVLYAAAFMAMGGVLWLAGSESAGVSLLAMLVVLPVFMRMRKMWVIAAVLAVLLAAAVGGDLARGGASKLRRFSQSKSVAIRPTMWGWGLKLVRRHPVMGLGAGGYLPHAQTVAARDMDRRPGYFGDITAQVHMEPLEVAVELGAVGLITYLLATIGPVAGVALLSGRSTTARPSGEGDLSKSGAAVDILRSRAGALAAGVGAIWLQSLFTVGLRFWSLPVVFWTAIGACLAAVRILAPARKEADAPRGAASADDAQTELPAPPSRAAEEQKPEGLFGPARTPVSASPRKGTSRRLAWTLMVLLVCALIPAWYVLVPRGLVGAVEADAMSATAKVSGRARARSLREAADHEVFYVDRVRARMALGRQLASAGHTDAALQQFMRVRELVADYANVDLMIGATLIDGGRFIDALGYLARYASLRPADTGTTKVLRHALRDLPAARAIAELKDLARDYPRFGKLDVVAGLIAWSMKPPKEDSAARSFAAALEIDPDDPQAAYLRAKQMLDETGDKGVPASVLNAARKLMCRSYNNGLREPGLYLDLAQLERISGNEEDARKLLEEARKRWPGDLRINEALNGR